MQDKNENVNSGASTTQSDSGTGTSQSDVAAAVRAAAASAQTSATQAAAASDAAQAAANTFSQTEAVSDISQSEAYIVNMKRLVENALNFDEQLKQIALQNLQLGQTSLANAVALANRVNNNAIDLDVRVKQDSLDTKVKTEGVAHGEREESLRNSKSTDIIREAQLSENPVMQDAIVASMVAAVDRYMAKKNQA
jgi:hypothetical protein